MVKIKDKVGAFNYWLSEDGTKYRLEGLKDNGDEMTNGQAMKVIRRARHMHPLFRFKIEANS